jgi:hypothetical protein
LGTHPRSSVSLVKDLLQASSMGPEGYDVSPMMVMRTVMALADNFDHMLPLDLHLQWAALRMAELQRQGLAERSSEVPVSPVSGTTHPSKASASLHLSMINFIIRPVLNPLHRMLAKNRYIYRRLGSLTVRKTHTHSFFFPFAALLCNWCGPLWQIVNTGCNNRHLRMKPQTIPSLRFLISLQSHFPFQHHSRACN